MKTKTVYVATKPVYLTGARGATKVLPVGHELTEREYRALNDARRAKFTAKTVTVGKPTFVHMTVGQIPAEARIDDGGSWHVGADELHMLQGDVRALAEENRALWCAAHPDIAWPGLMTGAYHGDPERRLTWFMDSHALAAHLPPMYAQQDVPCKLSTKKERARRGYQYNTAALTKTTERLRRGAEIFAYAEAIDRLLVEVQG
jgi:hypothetical protein